MTATNRFSTIVFVPFVTLLFLPVWAILHTERFSVHACVWVAFQKNKWVTLYFRVTPLRSLCALLNSLEQLGSILKPGLHTDPTHRYRYCHMHTLSNASYLLPPCFRGKHYTANILYHSTNVHYSLTSLLSHVKSHPAFWPFLLFFFYFLSSWSMKGSSFSPLPLHNLFSCSNELVLS